MMVGNMVGSVEGTQLCTASGEKLRHYGAHTLRLQVEGIEAPADATFQVVSVRSPIFSVVALYDAGHSVDFGAQLFVSKHESKSVLHRMGSLWFLKASVGSSWVPLLVDSGAS